jgi:hypothetical protein
MDDGSPYDTPESARKSLAPASRSQLLPSLDESNLRPGRGPDHPGRTLIYPGDTGGAASGGAPEGAGFGSQEGLALPLPRSCPAALFPDEPLDGPDAIRARP